MSQVFEDFQAYVAQIGGDKDKLHLFVNGTAEETVMTDNGQIPTLAGIIAAVAERGGVLSMSTIDAMSALPSPTDGLAVQVTTTGRAGLFRWQSGDLSAEVAADPERLIYVPAEDDLTGSIGAWVRSVAQFSRAPLPAFNPRPKPSKSKAIADMLAVTKAGHLTPGDGRIGVGSQKSDFSFETAINTQGGTWGILTISFRIAVAEYNKTGGDIEIQVQMDPSHYIGSSPRAFTHSDPALPSTGLVARGNLSHSGGGLYTITVSPDSGWEDYLGVDCRMIPTDSTNDDTLHPEYWAIQRITVTQDGNTLIDTDDKQGDLFVSQLLPKNTAATWATATVEVSGRTYYTAYNRFMSGGVYNYAWVSPNGSPSGFGPEHAPIDIARASEICALGQLENFFLYPGTYVYPGVRTQNVFNFVDNITVCCPEGRAVIDCGVSVSSGSMIAEDNHFKFAYDPTNNSDAFGINAGVRTPALIPDYDPPYSLREVSSVAAVDTTDNSYFWDNAAQEFHVRFDGTGPRNVTVAESYSLIKSPVNGWGMARIANVEARGMRDSIEVFVGGEWYESYSVKGRTARRDGIIVQRTDGVSVGDDFSGAGADGFNFHGYGNNDMWDCVANYCNDDGCSHHDDCTGIIHRGEFRFNGKAGVIPAFGAQVIAWRVTTEGNNRQSHPNANANNIGGIVALSYAEGYPNVNPQTGKPYTGARVVAIECESIGPERPLVSCGSGSYLYQYQCKSENSTRAFSTQNGSAHGHGKLIVQDVRVSGEIHAVLS